jgi:hypothetical protein
MVGTTTSNDGDVSGNAGGSDIWVAKIDSMGNLLWQNSIGGSLNEPDINLNQEYMSKYEVNTQKILIYITSRSIDGEMTGNLGSSDIWKASIDALENVNIQHTISSVNTDYFLNMWDFGGNLVPIYADTVGHLWVGTNVFPVPTYWDCSLARTTDGGYVIGWADDYSEFYTCQKYNSMQGYEGD